MTRGIIYYNRGTKMMVRLAVSMHSLRKHYDGPITILSQGDDSHKPCAEIAARFDATLKPVNYDQTPAKKNATYLNATLSHKHTPYDVTIWLDSDTTIHGDLTELFDAAERHEFAIAHFATWTTYKGRIGGRIQNWKGIHPDSWIEDARAFGPAINCGVFAFRKDSALMRDWWGLAVKGQHTHIPDETCCQLILPRYPHKIMPQQFNASCKYAAAEHLEGLRVMHYHGRKHCRVKDGKLLNHADLWYENFDEIREWGFVRRWIPSDRMLRKCLKKYDAMREGE